MTKIKDYQVIVNTENFNGVLTNEGTLDAVIEKLDSLKKDDILLDLVDNTADINKPVSTPTLNALNLKEDKSNKGVANGYASLDNTGKVPQSQLPSYVDDVLEFNDFASLPLTGESGKIYITLNDNKTYRWSGTTYVVLADTGVISVNGLGGDITLKTVNGNVLTGTGDIVITAGSASPLKFDVTNLLTDDGIGLNTLTTSGNTGIGYNTLFHTVIGNNNTAVGTNAVKGGSNNTGIGYNSLKQNTGNGNTALGKDSLQGNISDNNTGIGFSSLYSNWTGNHNTSVGFESGYNNSSGTYNTYLGVFSGRLNSSGNYNTGVGAYSIYNSTGNYNTSTGYNSLYSNTIGSNNSSFGCESLFSNTSGGYNIAFGYQSLRTNTTGSYNISVGDSSLRNNITGTSNCAFGSQSLYSNDSTSNNAFGYNSLRYNSSGSNNCAFGTESLYSNSSGSYNVAIGNRSLFYNIFGIGNVAIGYDSLFNNNAHANTSVGYKSLRNNTTGSNNCAFGSDSLSYNTTSSNNSAFGCSALTSNTGSDNSGFGCKSLNINTTGIANSAFGSNSLKNNTTGNHNTSIGFQSLNLNTTGYRNTAIGMNSLSNNTTFFNCSGLGYNSQITADNQVQLGDSTTTTYVYGTVQNRSDKRDKTEIRETSLGLDFINKVRPVEYKWNYREKYFEEIEEIIIVEEEKEEHKYIIELIDEDYIDGEEIKSRKVESKVYQYENTEEIIKFIDKDEEGNKFINTRIEVKQTPIMIKIIEKVEKKVLKNVEVVNDGSKAGKRFHQGVIAQEIKELIDLYGYDFGGFQDHSINGGKEVMSIGYDEFISPLIKAVQELSKEIEILKNK